MSTPWRESLRRLTQRPWRAALLVALLAAVALSAAHHEPRLGVSRHVAIRAALQDPQIRREVRSLHGVSIAVDPVDGHLTRVTFSVGGQVDAQAGVLGDGKVDTASEYTTVYANQRVPYGDWIAYEPAVLIGMSLLFVFATASLPLARRENVDVLAAVSLVGSIVLFAHRYVDLSMIATVPPLLYLAWRGVDVAVRGRRGTPGRALFAAATPWLDGAGRVRLLRLLLVALALTYFMVGVSSPVAVDVIYAVMEGATRIVHGLLPYGHMPGDIPHGDTYPLLSYALYAPLAALAPVNSLWDSVDGALAVAVAATLISAGFAARLVTGPVTRPAPRRRRDPEEEQRGLLAALALLAFPPLLIIVSTGTTDVVLAALLLGALLLWRRPAASTGVLAVAGWFKLAPFALLPLWLAPLRGRRLARAIAAVVAVSLALVVLLIALGGAGGPGAMISAVGYQFTRGSDQSIWSALGLTALQPLGEAAVLGLLTGSVLILRADAELAGDRLRVAALSGAVLIGLQLAANYWAFLYLAWVVPLLSVSGLGGAGELAERAPATTPGRALIAYDPAPVT